MNKHYKLVKCKKCGREKVVVVEDKTPEPKEMTQQIDESCECDEPLMT